MMEDIEENEKKIEIDMEEPCYTFFVDKRARETPLKPS